MTDTQYNKMIELLTQIQSAVINLSERVTKLEVRITKLEDRMTNLEYRMTKLEDEFHKHCEESTEAHKTLADMISDMHQSTSDLLHKNQQDTQQKTVRAIAYRLLGK